MSKNHFCLSQLQSGAELMALMVSDAPTVVLLDLGLPSDEMAIASTVKALGVKTII
jgi:DNA-binding NarL/FixJ family response regulator